MTSDTAQLYPREALLNGTWLARAHVGLGELEQACEVGRIALERLPQITSPRGLALLRRLADELRTRNFQRSHPGLQIVRLSYAQQPTGAGPGTRATG